MQNETSEYEVSDPPTLAEVYTVSNKMALREPVSPNAIYRSLIWAAQRIEKLEAHIETTISSGRETIDAK